MSSCEFRMLWEQLETSYGELEPNFTTQDTTLSTSVSEAMLVRNLRMNFVAGDYQRREFATGMEGAQDEDLLNVHATLSYEVEAAPPTAAGVRPKVHPALKSCGFDTTIVADTSVSYSPKASDAVVRWDSTEIKMVAREFKQRVWGCRGSMSFTMEANRKPFFAFSKMGQWTRGGTGSMQVPDFSTWPAALERNRFNMPADAVTLGGVTQEELRAAARRIWHGAAGPPPGR